MSSNHVAGRRAFHAAAPRRLWPVVLGVSVVAGSLMLRALLRMAKEEAEKQQQQQQQQPKRTGDGEEDEDAAEGDEEQAARPRATLGSVLGLDLGALNNRAAVPVFDGSGGSVRSVRVLEDANGARFSPAVVGFDREHVPVAGLMAKKMYRANAGVAVVGLKHVLGRDIGDPATLAFLQRNPGVQASTDAANRLLLRVNGRDATPVELATEMLSALRQSAEDSVGRTLSHAAISVPVSYGDAQKEALETACNESGLDVLSFVEDPVAAVLANNFYARASAPALATGTYLVVDAGATAKAAVVAVRESGDYPEVVAHADGSAFDLTRADELLLREITNVDLMLDPLAVARLHEAVESTRAELSTNPHVEINIPYITMDQRGPKHLRMPLSRFRYEQIVDDVMRIPAAVCEQALANANASASAPSTVRIDRVLLAGAGSRAPRVGVLLDDMVRRLRLDASRSTSDVAPEDVHAIGAALEAVRVVRDQAY